MPDITMCSFQCPVHLSCYRFIAVPSEYGQDYFTERPYQITTRNQRLMTQRTLRENIVDEFHCQYYWAANSNEIEIYKKRQKQKYNRKTQKKT